MRHVLVACLVIATLEAPIGNSMQGFVMRHAIQWCEGADFPILVETSVLLGEDGPPVGAIQRRYYAVPQAGVEPTPRDEPMKPNNQWGPG